MRDRLHHTVLLATDRTRPGLLSLGGSLPNRDTVPILVIVIIIFGILYLK